jgi:hypothetical protein
MDHIKTSLKNDNPPPKKKLYENGPMIFVPKIWRSFVEFGDFFVFLEVFLYYLGGFSFIGRKNSRNKITYGLLFIYLNCFKIFKDKIV